MRSSVLVAVSAAVLAVGCVSEQTYQTEVKKADLYQTLNKQLQTEINADQVQIQQLQDRVKVTMVDQILFPEGGWQISRKGEETLEKIVPALKTLKNQRVVVEGFTDNVPIGPALKQRFPSNWEFSTTRATDVVRFLAARGVSQNILSAEGFGDSRPVASNDTPQGKATPAGPSLPSRPAVRGPFA